MKKSMRRIGFIISLALILTIGGVYATFYYAQGNADDQSSNIGYTIAGTDVETKKGTITV